MHFFCFFNFFCIFLLQISKNVSKEMKLFNFYHDNIDKTWYQSSNIKYSECVDVENDFKKLKVVFSTGSQYLYEDVDVRDYLQFREASSQGRSLNELRRAKGWKCTRLEDANLEQLDEEYALRSGNGLFIQNNDKFVLFDNKNTVLFEKTTKLNEEELLTVIGILNSLGKQVKIIEQ